MNMHKFDKLSKFVFYSQQLFKAKHLSTYYVRVVPIIILLMVMIMIFKHHCLSNPELC